MNPFRRLLDFFRNPSNSRTVSILAVFVIALAIPLTVNIAQKQQETRQHAAEISEGGGTCDPSLPCSGWSYTTCTLNDNGNSVPGFKASCGGTQDQTCYAGPAPDLSSCPKPISSAPNPALTQPKTCAELNGHCSIICPVGFCTPIRDVPGCNFPEQCVQNSNPPGTTEGCYVIGLAPSNCHQGGSNVCGIPEVPFICESNPPTVTLQPPCPKFVPDGAIGSIGDYVQNGVRYTCNLLAPVPGTSCEKNLGGQCLPPQIGFGDGLTRLYSGNCDNSSHECFAKYESSGNTTIGPGGTLTINKQCTKDAPGGRWDYVCGSNAGCPAGQHKAAYICPNVGTWAEDQTCYPDSAFTGTNPCAGAPGAAPGGGTTSPACTATSPGKWSYTCGTAAGCTATQHKATRICDGGGTSPDPQCYEGTNFTVDGKNYVNCVAQTSPPTSATLAAGACGANINPVCTQSGCQLFSTKEGNWQCLNSTTQAQCSTPTCPSTATPPVGGACKTDSASAVSCAFACQVVNGVNMKCNIQNKDANGVCSGACTGQWNCAVDSACQNPNGVILSFAIGLDGIGTTGDVKNPNLSNTRSPNRAIRNLTTQLINSSRTVTSTNNGNISYSSGKFTANVNLGSVTPGTYTVKIKSDGYLSRLISAPLTVTAGTVTYTLSGSVSLVTGDINGNNQLDINDYQILLSCSTFSNDNHAACNSNSSYPALSDLDDNGVVDQLDYNLFVREISQVQNGD